MGPEFVTTNELYYLDVDTRCIIKLAGIKTVNEARSEIGLDPVGDIATIPLNYSIEFTVSFNVDDNEIIFDLTHPVKCNCRNCGAPVRLEYCEYCGTKYRLYKWVNQ